MNKERKHIPIAQPIPTAEGRMGSGSGVPRLRALRQRLARRARTELGDRLPAELIDRALRDAEALAGASALPEFLFPGLAEEKIEEVIRWHRHQQALLERTAVAFAA